MVQTFPDMTLGGSWLSHVFDGVDALRDDRQHDDDQFKDKGRRDHN